MALIRRPDIRDWRLWSWSDYLTYFLCQQAAKARAQRREPDIFRILGQSEFERFCAPIKDRLTYLFGGSRPLVSIQMPARNDAMELLATLVSYTLLKVQPGSAEIIVADNGSTDSTPFVIRACGVKSAYAPVTGLGKARRAAYDCMCPSAEFVWLTDADARVVPPLVRRVGRLSQSSVLETSLAAIQEHDEVIALSTGIEYEWAHPSYYFVRKIALALGQAPRIHCFSGPNQFIRAQALSAIGGINPEIGHRQRDDHQRLYELARYAKPRGLKILSAATSRGLYDPVYHSGRNRGTLREVVIAVLSGKQSPRGPRDSYGWPVHPLDRIRDT